MLTSPAHAIELLGGPGPVSGRLDRKYTTVSSWAARQSIPIEEWPNLVELAREQNIAEVTFESLAVAHVKRKSPAEPAKGTAA